MPLLFSGNLQSTLNASQCKYSNFFTTKVNFFQWISIWMNKQHHSLLKQTAFANCLTNLNIMKYIWSTKLVSGLLFKLEHSQCAPRQILHVGVCRDQINNMQTSSDVKIMDWWKKSQTHFWVIIFDGGPDITQPHRNQHTQKEFKKFHFNMKHQQSWCDRN